MKTAGTRNSTTAVLLSVAALILLVYVLYAPTVNDPLFLWDDRYLIENNEFIHDLGNLPHLFTQKYFTQVYELSYRPLGTFTLMLNYAADGANPAGYRVVNITLLCLNALLLFMLVLKLPVLKTGLFAAALSAALFATHPVHTETVGGITFREDLLCLLFVLLSAILYFRRKGGVTGVLLPAAAFMLALLSKETALVLPAFLFLSEIFLLRRDEPGPWLGRAIIRLTPFALTAAGYLVLRFSIFQSPQEQFIYHGGSFYQTFLLTCRAWMKYLQLTIFPVSQCFDYTASTRIAPSGMNLSLFGFICFMMLPWVLVTKNRVAGLGIFWFVLFLLPVSNIIPIGVIMAERYLTIPVAGAAMAIAALLTFNKSDDKTSPESKRFTFTHLVPYVACCYLLACFVLFTMHRNRDWRNEIVFWQQTTTCAPDSAQTFINLGLACDAAGNPVLAETSLRRAVGLASLNDPLKDRYGSLHRAHGNLGMVLAKQGKFEEAAFHLRNALAIHPGYMHAQTNLDIMISTCRARAEKFEMYQDYQESGKYYHILKKIDPLNAQYYNKKIRRLSH